MSSNRSKNHFRQPHLWLIAVLGVIVPRRLRADWKQEWEAELRCRELLLADWDKLNWRTKLDLLRRSLGAFRDALLLQPRRLEDEMSQDLRFGLRMLLKQPSFTLIAIFTLALGVGANTAIFSVVNAVLLRPLPYPQADRMVLLWGNFLKINITQLPAKTAEYVDYRDQTQSFDQVAAFYPADVHLTGSGQPERIAGARVSANLFALLEAQPAQGRVIAADENQQGRDNAAVVSHAFWQQRLGGAANVIGQQVKLNDLNYTIIGVMPTEFQFPHASFGFAEPAEVWLPLVLNPAQLAERGGSYAVNVLARLKPQVTLPQAQAELSALAQKFEREYRGYRGPNNADGGWRITAVPMQEQITGANRTRGRHRSREWLVVGEVALALPLLIGAGLLLNSFVRLQRVKPGVDADKILITEINLPATKYREPARAEAFFEELMQRVAVLPGVEHASVGTLPILSGAAISDAFSTGISLPRCVARYWRLIETSR